MYGKKYSYPCNRPWWPIGLWHVEAPTLSRQSAHRWRWGCQPHAPAALYPQEDSSYSFLLEAESTRGAYCILQPTASCSNWFLARGFFYPEDGGDMFLPKCLFIQDLHGAAFFIVTAVKTSNPTKLGRLDRERNGFKWLRIGSMAGTCEGGPRGRECPD
jgi:hypothetical protein